MPTPKTLASSISVPATIGSFQNAIGNLLAGGSITLDISQVATVIGGGEVVSSRVTVSLDANAKVASGQVIWANDQLLPSGTTYKMSVFDSSGNFSGDFGNVVLSGTQPIDLAAIIPVSSSGGGISFTGIVLTAPPAQQVITGFPLIMAGVPFGFSASGTTTLDAAFSRLAPNSIGIGNGTQGDTSGTFGAAVLNAITGFRVNNAAASGTFLKGNGTNYVSGTITLASSDFANQGTTTTVLHGNAAGNPSFSAVSLTADVTGTLGVANGGTGVTTSTGSVNNVLSNSPTIVTPVIDTVVGAAGAPVHIKPGAASVGQSMIVQDSSGTSLLVVGVAGDVLLQIPGKVIQFQGSSSGSTNIGASATATGTALLPAISGTDTLVGNVTSATLTTKRITPRTVAVADATSITPNGDTTDTVFQNNTQTAGTLTINAPTGTPTDGQKLIFRIKALNAQTYSFNATYRFSTSVTAPTTLAAGKTDYLGAMWNATDSKWDVVATDQGH